MLKKINIDKILKENPSVSKKSLKKNTSLAGKLKDMGVKPRGYQLPPPYKRHRARVGEVENIDSRTIHLSSQKQGTATGAPGF